MLKNKQKIKQIKEKHEADSNIVAIIASIIILLGGFIFSYNYINSKKTIAYDHIINVFYNTNESNKTESTENVEEKQPEEEIKNNTKTTYDYIGYLEIPKINLKKGFVKKESSANNVEKNIYIVDKSDYPDKEKGNFIIAGHSGTGWKAFFNDLYKLKKDNVIYVTYGNKKYTYKIDNIYTQKKTGTIAIYRDYSKTTLTLVTCTNNDNTTQTVYIGYLEKVTEE